MKFYLDFEATRFSNRIISIGCVAENGNTFSTLVKPGKKKKVDSFRYSRIKTINLIWSGLRDSNPRSLGPKSSNYRPYSAFQLHLMVFSSRKLLYKRISC